MTQKTNKSANGMRFVIARYFILYVLIILIIIILVVILMFKVVYKRTVINRLEETSVFLINSYVKDDYITFSKNVSRFIVEENIYTCIYDSNYNVLDNSLDHYIPFDKGQISFVFTKLNDENKNTITLLINEEIMTSVSKVNDDGIIYYMVFYTRILPINRVIRSFNNGLAWVLIVIAIFTAIVSYYTSKRLAKPIKVLEKKVLLLSKNDPNLVFDVSGYDEIDSLNNALNYANQEICKSSTLRQNIMSNVSHDLRTPLTLIKAYAEMIKDISGDNPEQRNAHLDIIIKETDRLTGLVNNILEISKIENDLTLNISKFNLSLLILDTMNSFNVLKNDGYEFVLNVEENIFVDADSEKIKQVLYNLISNAVNYTLEKRVYINLTFKDSKALVEIIDCGKGIEDEKISTIWDRYYRDEENHVRSVVGSGLGLSIVKKILEKHNIEYGVKSKINEGSNFYFVITGEKMS